MEVIKRNGNKERVSFDKITNRIAALCNGLDAKFVDPIKIAKETINGLFDGITTQELDLLSADICASKIQQHPHFNKLAARILISNLHKSTENNYLQIVNRLFQNGVISDSFYNFVKENITSIEEMFDYNRDYLFDFFGFKTLERSYLLRLRKEGDDKKFVILERPQHMWMRVAIQIHGLHPQGDIRTKLSKIKETYDNLSELYFTHATPTLFNSGSKYPQLSSCFLLNIDDDITNIFKTVGDIGQISKWAGGIGIHLSSIRSKGSLIKSTYGQAEGIIPLCKVLESVARLINQSGKRLGSIACYLEPWHADIQNFIDLRKNTGDELLRARDLFLALWVPDLFMRRVNENGEWSLMSPDVCPGLNDTYGEEFEKLYERYETEGKFVKKIKAMDLWRQILESQIETGMPYLLFKDHVNCKSNQKNLGTIKSSNLCVSGETRILTQEKGWVEIKECENYYYHIWNGIEWSKSMIRKTSDSSPLREILFSDGSVIRCTDEHQFILESGTRVNAKDIPMHTRLKCVSILPVLKGIQVKVNGEEFNSETFFKNNLVYTERAAYFYSNSEKILLDVKLFLQTCGINGRIDYINRRIVLSLEDIAFIEKLEQNNPPSVRFQENSLPIYVVSNQTLNLSGPTWCFGEPRLNQGMFNGLLAGNCAEIVEYSDRDNIAVCNLASICLPRFVEEIEGNKIFNFQKLGEIASIVTSNLNKVIDLNFYPVPETKNSNMANRPIGIGVQGLADVYCKMRIAFDSEEARLLNRRIFETIYYHSLRSSIFLAKEEGAYSNFQGSPSSEGLFQWDMWGLSPDRLLCGYDWEILREEMKIYGLRNSLLTACMPTASTSQIMGNCESIEPYSSNIFVRKTLAGEYTVVNENLINDLINLGLWTKEIYEEILYFNGSVQKIREIPEQIKRLYKTAFEIKGIEIVSQAIERGPFIDQTQSMNLFQDVPNFNKLSSSHFYSWKNGLKTGMYYLRTRPVVDPIKFGLDPNSLIRIKGKYRENGTEGANCKWKPGMKVEDCEMCSS